MRVLVGLVGFVMVVVLVGEIDDLHGRTGYGWVLLMEAAVVFNSGLG